MLSLGPMIQEYPTSLIKGLMETLFEPPNGELYMQIKLLPCKLENYQHPWLCEHLRHAHSVASLSLRGKNFFQKKLPINCMQITDFNFRAEFFIFREDAAGLIILILFFVS